MPTQLRKSNADTTGCPEGLIMADTIDSDEVKAEGVDGQCDVNLEDCVNVEDGLNVEDGVNLKERVNVEDSSSGPLEPFIGMIFDDVEDAQAFYKVYARRKVDYVCTREGFRRVSRKEKEQTVPKIAETKIGYKAIMGVKKDGEKWMVNKFVVGHNHILLTSRSASLLRGNRKLLRTWQKAMLGKAPATIITDDDKAMAKAIAKILPNTTYRLYLWHILQKFPEHLAHVYNKFLDFGTDFRHYIHETITTDEFE
ncbi:uncharacterized protein LOC122306393 [Carya illinoinensis]|uniref:uncharacterized protein LOC122306393 n=1 Tax=Carya illinoinensis TaxID=32201 RepID=UPI001C71B9AF|nr:uncharacterized protein LOC122306393 [Carya illinoinensis]